MFSKSLISLLALIMSVTAAQAIEEILSADIPDKFSFAYHLRVGGEEILKRKISCNHEKNVWVEGEDTWFSRKKIKSCWTRYLSDRNELPIVDGCDWGFGTPDIKTWHQGFSDLVAKKISTDGIPDDLLQLDFKDAGLTRRLIPIEMVTPLDNSMKLVEMKAWRGEKLNARLLVTFDRLTRDADQEQGIIIKTIGRGYNDKEKSECEVPVEFEFLILKE